MRASLQTTGMLVVAMALSPLVPAAARADNGTVQNQVSVYTGANAVGYLQPLTNAFGAALNSSFGYSAYIPRAGYHFSLEMPVMGVIFDDGDRFFNASTEAGFQPPTTTSVPTAVGAATMPTSVTTNRISASMVVP